MLGFRHRTLYLSIDEMSDRMSGVLHFLTNKDIINSEVLDG